MTATTPTAVAEEAAQQESRIVATYDYTDERGELLFQVCRLDPKDFRQRAPGPGGLRWTTKGVRRVLYRLPEVLRAVEQGERVYVCEGEKDADSMAEAGFFATTNPAGAGRGKWLPSYSETLKGADVCVIADRDKAGRDHAKEVARSLAGIAKCVRVIECPDIYGAPVKDATDFFDAFGTVEELVAIADATEPEASTGEVTEEADKASVATADGASPVIVLPSGDVTISASARDIFQRIGPTNTMFSRGGAVVELVTIGGIEQFEAVKAEHFRSRIERYGLPVAWRFSKSTGSELKPTACPRDTASALLATLEARELLPEVASVLRCPVLVETPEGQVKVLGQYHPAEG